MTALERLEAAGVLGALDLELAALIGRLEPGVDPDVQLAAALASAAIAKGDVCVDLRALAAPTDEEGVALPDWAWPEPGTWLGALQGCALIGEGGGREPLVLRGSRLYLARYEVCEAEVAARLKALSEGEVAPVQAALVEAALERLFPGSWRNEEQMEAVRAAAGRRLTVLAGGPGTGKTTTVVRLLAVLIEQALARGEAPPSVLLLAPTGKAAARLAESIASQRGLLASSGAVSAEVLAAIPASAMTIHRALRPRNDWLTRFVHDASNPWPHDLVLLDEVSMVDLPMMARTLAAVGPRARLVLLGDPDQLPSVGPGAVLGDLCALQGEQGLGTSLSRLVKSRRFDAGGGVGKMARAIHEEDLDALRALAAAPALDARIIAPEGRLSRSSAFLGGAVSGWTAFCQAQGPAAKLAAMDQFRVLCATRVGADGVEAVNLAIERALRREGLLWPNEDWYDGRPILITTNDYQLDLYNGDTGVVAREEPDEPLKAWFPDGSGGLRGIAPARLPAHETCFAMTVHKSQGSEFSSVMLGLPNKPGRVLSRELLYTGVTRAKKVITLVGVAEVVEAAVRRPARRTTGLTARLR
jgi:exodeoxyribonuclease V alpha subunit